MLDAAMHVRRMVESDKVSALRRCRIAMTKNAFAVFVLLIHFSALMSCSSDREDSLSVADAPVEVVFTDVKPAVENLIGRLLDNARHELSSGSRRGELGMAYEIHGFPNAAYTSYIQAESREPTNARWPYFQALMLAKLGVHEQALAALDRTVEIEPEYGAAWMWRATWSLDVGLTGQAEEGFERARLLGLEAVADAGIARLRLHQDRPEEAATILESLIQKARYPSIYQLLGRAYREMGRIDDARIALARGRTTQPISWSDAWEEEKKAYEVGFQARILRSQRLLKLDRLGEALTILEALIEEEPGNPVVISTLSSAYAKSGEITEAFLTLRRALRRESVDYTVHANIAPFYENRGDHEIALQHLDRAIELNPSVAFPYTRKGLLLQKLGRYEDALVAFEHALGNSANDPHNFFYAGDVEALLQRWDKAIYRFNQSITVDPSFTLGHLNLGLALARETRFAEARAALERAKTLGTHDGDVARALGYVARLEKGSN